MQRVTGTPELLDGPLDDPVTLSGNLRDLRRANRWFGGATLSCRAVDALVGGQDDATILDVGTGAADIPIALLTSGRRNGRTRRLTAVDSRPEIIDAVRRTWPDVMHRSNLTLDVADGRSLPYPDGAFDVAHASLVLHHLDPADVIAFLCELGRVARRGVVINDLDRTWPTLLGAWLASRLFTTNRYSRHDAPLSARRAYTLGEARELLHAADLRPVAEVRGLAGHRWAIAAVPT